MPVQSNGFYETHEYREKWDDDFRPEAIHAKYDHEQNERIKRIGVENIRNKTVLDLGASSGVFLDALKGLAGRTIAVEPANIYSDYHKSQGHVYYPYPENAIEAGEKADLVTSFDVIEHVNDPRAFIDSAYSLLKPGGSFILSMPNQNDLLLSYNKKYFEPFFYQTAHLNYFSYKSASYLLENSEFTSFKIDYLHKYGVMNLMQWLKNGLPGSMLETKNLFDRYAEESFRIEIERLGIASHIFIKAVRG